MIYGIDLSQIGIFSELSPQERNHYAEKAADVRLEAGDLLISEGERSHFYVVLAGSLKVEKEIHGVQYTLAQHSPGDFLGDLPCLLGLPSGVAVKASTRCRVARFERQQLQELVKEGSASSPIIMASMIGSLHGAQRLAQGIPATRVDLSGMREDRVCQRIRAFLSAGHIPYEWQAFDASSRERSPQDLKVVIDAQHTLTNPGLREVADALGFQTKPKLDKYDVVIIGAGPAGMAAGVYGASEGLQVLLVEREFAGGQAGTSSRIENYLGFPSGISGEDLSNRALRQAQRFGAEFAMARSVEALVPTAGGYVVTLDDNEQVFSRCVLVATGVDWRLIKVPGLDDHLGKGVLYGASRTEALSVSDKRVFIVGGGNSAGQAAMFFSDYAKEVRLLVRGQSLSSSMSQYLIDQLHSKENIAIELATEIVEVRGDGAMRELATSTRTSHGDVQDRIWPADALFIMIGAEARTGWLPAELQRDSKGFICTGRAVTGQDGSRMPLPLESSMPGLFCAGDVRHDSIKRVASGVGEGSMSIAFIHEYLASVSRATESIGRMN